MHLSPNLEISWQKKYIQNIGDNYELRKWHKTEIQFVVVYIDNYDINYLSPEQVVHNTGGNKAV